MRLFRFILSLFLAFGLAVPQGVFAEFPGAERMPVWRIPPAFIQSQALIQQAEWTEQPLMTPKISARLRREAVPHRKPHQNPTTPVVLQALKLLQKNASGNEKSADIYLLALTAGDADFLNRLENRASPEHLDAHLYNLGVAAARSSAHGRKLARLAASKFVAAQADSVREYALWTLASAAEAGLAEGERPDLSPFQEKLLDRAVTVRIQAVSALLCLYTAQAKQNIRIDEEAIRKLESAYVLYGNTSFKDYGELYRMLWNHGQFIPFDFLVEHLQNGVNQLIAAEAVGPLYVKQIERGMDPDLRALERLAQKHSGDESPATKSLIAIHQARFKAGKLSISELEEKLSSLPKYYTSGTDERYEILAVNYQQALAAKTLLPADLEMKLKKADAPEFIVLAAEHALGHWYLGEMRQGKVVSIQVLTDMIGKYVNDHKPLHEVVIPLVTEQLLRGERTVESLEEHMNAFMNGANSWSPIARAAIEAYWAREIARAGPGSAAIVAAWETRTDRQLLPLVSVLAERARHFFEGGVPAGLPLLEKIAARESRNWKTRDEIGKDLTSVYAAWEDSGKIDASALSVRAWNNNNTTYVFEHRRSKPKAPAPAAEKDELASWLRQHPADAEEAMRRLASWSALNLPDMPESLLAGFAASEDPEMFIRDLREKAASINENGFGYENQDERLWSFMGVRLAGFDVTLSEFNERINALAAYDQLHPGSFARLFTKTRGMKSIQLTTVGSVEGRKELDTTLLEQHVETLFGIQTRMDALDWLPDAVQDQNPQSKVLNVRNLYFQMERQRASDAGTLRLDERFRVEFPDPGVMRERLRADRPLFYRTLFIQLATRLSAPATRDAYLRIMRDLIVCDALSDAALARQILSDDLEDRLAALSNLYNTYKMHLPASVALRLEALRGLPQELEALSAPIDPVLREAGHRVTSGALQLIPAGFLAVFRGRAGIADCSFFTDTRLGYAFTRAMHEDTFYYLVRSGSHLKGYVGLMNGRLEDGRPVLTVDTINSPSIDGVERMTQLVNELQMRALAQGQEGVAFPHDIYAGGYFNFDNVHTLTALPVYRRTKKIRVLPVHQESWKTMEAAFGPDSANSMTNGDFRLLQQSATASIWTAADALAWWGNAWGEIAHWSLARLLRLSAKIVWKPAGAITPYTEVTSLPVRGGRALALSFSHPLLNAVVAVLPFLLTNRELGSLWHMGLLINAVMNAWTFLLNLARSYSINWRAIALTACLPILYPLEVIRLSLQRSPINERMGLAYAITQFSQELRKFFSQVTWAHIKQTDSDWNRALYAMGGDRWGVKPQGNRLRGLGKAA